MRYLASLLCLCICLAAPVHAQTSETVQVSKQDIVRLLGRIFTDEAARADLVRLGFRGENLTLASGQMRAMMSDPNIAGYIADQIIAFQKSGTIHDTAGAGGVLWSAIDRGIGHLPQADLRYYYLVEQTVLNAMSTRDCGLAVKERLSPARLSDATARAAERLNTPALKNYYRIQLRAARYGATRDAVRMSESKANRVEDKIFNALLSRLTAADNGQDMIRTFARIDRADNRRACAAGRLFIDAVLSLKGRDQHDALILLSLP